VDAELFKSLQEIHGKNYRDFMLKKIIPVLGNVRETGMGIKSEIAEEIAEEVDIIVNSAANTTFDERFDFNYLKFNIYNGFLILIKTLTKVDIYTYV
jgi:alcohol-forming fatty acyl-CoA reductase